VSALPPIAHLRLMMSYSAWANSRLFETLAAVPVDAPALAGMLKTLNHAYVVDLIWQAHLQGRPHGFPERNTAVQPSLPTLRVLQADSDRWYSRYADALGDTAQDELVHFEFVDGGASAMTRAQMLLHIANHKTYHRGYVAQMLYGMGGKPPVMDLPVFLRDTSSA
jgi:uncharacterized damage-inducible protein DinB